MADSAQVAFHKGDFVVVAAPPPDAFWLAQALSDVDCMYSAGAPTGTAEAGSTNTSTSASASATGGSSSLGLGSPALGSAAAGEPTGLFTPVRFLERVASFENGDDLYRSWKEEQVRKLAIVCAAKVQLRDGRDAAAAGVSAEPRQFVLPLAERHRIVAFLASTYGADTPAEAVLADGLGVAALVSSAAFDRAAFLLVKWAGLECAMTWEPRALLAAACPELLAHYEAAPYKLAISFPSPQPQPILDAAADTGAAAAAAAGPGAPGVPHSPRGKGDGDSGARGGRRGGVHGGRGRGGGKTRGTRGARLSHSAVVAAITEALGPVPPPPAQPAQPQPQPQPQPGSSTSAPADTAA